MSTRRRFLAGRRADHGEMSHIDLVEGGPVFMSREEGRAVERCLRGPARRCFSVSPILSQCLPLRLRLDAPRAACRRRRRPDCAGKIERGRRPGRASEKAARCTFQRRGSVMLDGGRGCGCGGVEIMGELRLLSAIELHCSLPLSLGRGGRGRGRRRSSAFGARARPSPRGGGGGQSTTSFSLDAPDVRRADISLRACRRRCGTSRPGICRCARPRPRSAR